MMLHRNLPRGLAMTPVATLLAVSGLNAWAGNPTELEPVVVTASRSAQTVDDALAPVTVITRADIERRQIASVPEALRRVPGLNLTNSGGPGKATSIYLRGTESDHVLVLVDGVKIGSATLGTASIQDLPIDLIERIEIVRGPRAALYGSEALGGVIQIFTRRGEGEARMHGAVSFGSHDTVKTTVGGSGRVGDAWYALNLSHHQTSGFDAVKTSEPDADGYTNESLVARVGTRFVGGGELEGQWLQTFADNEFDGTTSNESNSAQQVLSVSLRQPLTESWDTSVQVSRAYDHSENFLNGVFSSRFNTDREQLSWQNDIAIGDDGLVVAGLDYNNDRIDSTSAYTVSSRANTGVFAQWQGKYQTVDVQAALRHDDNQQFGANDTGNLAVGVDLAGGFRLTGAYGSAFKAPTFNELYFPGFGNANLRPEESESIEIGLHWHRGDTRVAAQLYQTEIDDLIGFDPLFNPVNIDTARIQGLELTLNDRLGAYQVDAALTLQDPRNLASGTNNDKLLNRRPQQILDVDISRDFGRYGVAVAWHAEGRRFNDLANNNRLGGFGTLDLRADVDLDKDWQLQGRIVNLLDKNYETARTFNQEGQAVYLTLRYAP